MQQERIRKIVEKVGLCRERRVATFGSDTHCFALERVSEAELAAFETKHGVALPPDFRAFLVQAGIGAGPYYGLLGPSRLGDVLYGDGDPIASIAKPFLFAPETKRTDEAFEAAKKDTDEPFQGAIAIADQGCAYYAALVVAGPHAGRVVYVSLDGGVPLFVESPDFLSWYERWVDELLAGCKHFWFGTDMPGSEAELTAIAKDARAPRRADALAAMYKLPRLDDATQAVVATRIRDVDASVRGAALGLAAKFALVETSHHVRAALDDAVAGVRAAALSALVAIGGAWHDDARRMLRDADDEVASRALRELEKAKALREEDALPLVACGRERIVEASLRALASMPSERVAAAAIPLASDDGERDVAGECSVPTPLASESVGRAALATMLACVRVGQITDAQRREALDVVLARAAQRLHAIELQALAAFAAREPRALETLVAATRHEDGFVRFDAAIALGETGCIEAIDALEALASDATLPRDTNRSTAWSVGESAKRALAKIRARLGNA
ncbi:MAG TPA: SMI1/KNR4 family protein [Labilithrix sp.]